MKPSLLFSVTASVACAAGASAQQLTATVEIPQLDVAEYHRPYVALWLEGPNGAHTNVGVWYDIDMKNDEGETWLKDMRQWWRKSGRELDLPIAGVSGPTRPVGKHEVALPAALPPGEYALVVEAAREVGGREVVRVPFRWDAAAPVNTSARGERELGTISISTR